MHSQIYNSSIPTAYSKSVNRPVCRFRRLCFASFLLPLLLSTSLFGADWSGAEQQLAKKIVAVTGPGTLSLTVENRSSLGRRESDIVQNGLRSALEQSGIHFAKSEQAAAIIALTLSENETSYVWVAQIQQGTNDAAVVMVSVPRTGHSAATSESMPISLRKVSLFAQDARILDLAVLEENGSPTRLAILNSEDVSVYRLQNAKWQLEQALPIAHSNAWPLDLRGRLVVTVDHALNAYMPGVICRIAVNTAPLTINCHASDDPWPIVPVFAGTVFPTPGSNIPSSATVPAESGFFASTRNYFTGVLSPAVGKFSTVPKFYTAAFIPREKYTLWLFASADGRVHMVDGLNDQPSSVAWGSDIAALRTACGAGYQVLATLPGDRTQDSIRAYELPDREPVAVSAPVDLPGPVSALWSEARGDSAIAIAQNQDTRSYEAFRLSLACGQ